MILVSLNLLGSTFQGIVFNENINSIIGHTGARKTLLYKLIMFVFSFPISLDIDKTKSNFPNITYVELTIKDGDKNIVLKREVSNKFHAFVGQKEFDNVKKYNQEINSLFGLKTVYVENGTKTFGFGFKEFLNYVFVPEEQLSANKPIFLREGFSERDKIVNFFRYIVSGKAIDEKEVKEKTIIKRDKKAVKSFKTTLNRTIKKPSQKDVKKRNSIAIEIEKVEGLLVHCDETLLKLASNKKEHSLALERMNSLYKTYLTIFEEAKIGISFEEATIGEANISETDMLLFQNIKEEFAGLRQTIDYSSERLRSVESEIEKCINEKTELQRQLKEYHEQLNELSYIHDYELIQSASNKLSDSVDKKENEVQEKIKSAEQTIETVYKNNLSLLCSNVSSRLEKWGFQNITVRFDGNSSDFQFNEERLSIVPKGLKSIYSLAVAVEILKISSDNKITNLKTVLADSIWVATDKDNKTKEEIANSIVSDLKDEDIQVVLFENTVELVEQEGLKIITI